MSQTEQTTSVTEETPAAVSQAEVIKSADITAAENQMTLQQERIKAKKAFSRFALSIILSFLCSTVITVILQSISNNMGKSGVLDQSLVDSTTFQLLLSVVPVLLVCYPMIYLLAKKMPSHAPQRNPFKASHEVMFFFITISAMFAGNIISTVIAGLLTSGQAQNNLVDIVSKQEIVPIVYTALIAPVVEELIFRKLLLDKLSVYGEKWAIIFGALCFAMFHFNIYQIIYTFCMGLIMGYIYIKSGNIINTIILHIAVNILGGTIAPMALGALDQKSLMEITELLDQGKEIPEALINAVLPGLLIYGIYMIIYFAIVITGIILFIVNCKKFRTERSELLPTAKEGVPAIAANAGMIVFFVFSGLIITLQLLSPYMNGASN